MRIWLGAACALTLLFTLTGLTLAQRWTPSQETVAWQLVFGYNSRIFVSDLGDGEAQVLEYNGRPLSQAVCSANGEAMAFVQGGLLYVTNTDSPAVEQLTGEVSRFVSLTISNGMEQLVYSTDDPLLGFKVFHVDLVTRRWTLLSTDWRFVPMALAIAPDASQLAYEWRDRTTTAVPEIRLSAANSLAGFIELPDGHSPVWSPDGRMLAMQRDGDLLLMDVKHQRSARLTHDKRRPFYMAWLPDGSGVGYLAFEQGDANIFLFDLATREHRRIASLPGWEYAPCFLVARPPALVQR